MSEQTHMLNPNQHRTVRALMNEHDEHMRQMHATREAIAALARVYASVEGLPVDRAEFSQGPAGQIRLEVRPKPEETPEALQDETGAGGKEEEDDSLQDIA